MYVKIHNVDSECRIFLEKWTDEWYYVSVNGKFLFLISSENMAVLEEYNLAGHFEEQVSYKTKFGGITSRDGIIKECIQKTIQWHFFCIAGSYYMCNFLTTEIKPFSWCGIR